MPGLPVAPAGVTTVSRDTSAEDIVAIIQRDGGVIVKDMFSDDVVDELGQACEPYFEAQSPARAKIAKQMSEFTEQAPEGFFANNTIHTYALISKAPKAVSKVLAHPTYVTVMDTILGHTRPFVVGTNGAKVIHETSWKLSSTAAMRVTSGAGNQTLHRDQTIHSVDAKEGSLYTSLVGVLVAGTDTAKRNGATRVCPGSHLWPADRVPTENDVASAEMSKGSALFFLGSVYHGGGSNTALPGDPDEVRTVYAIFGCCDFYEAEENSILSCPIEVARELPYEALRRTSWVKTVGGASWFELGHAAESYLPFKASVGRKM